MKIRLVAWMCGLFIVLQSHSARATELKLAVITIIAEAEGVSYRQFTTFPQMYLGEICESKRIELLNHINKPEIGSRDIHATGRCFFINEKDVTHLKSGLEDIQARKFISDARFQRNMIMSTTDGKTFVLPTFNLTSREDCIQSGQFHVRNMLGVRLDAEGTKIESIDFNCNRLGDDDVRSMLKQLKEAGH